MILKIMMFLDDFFLLLLKSRLGNNRRYILDIPEMFFIPIRKS